LADYFQIYLRDEAYPDLPDDYTDETIARGLVAGPCAVIFHTVRTMPVPWRSIILFNSALVNRTFRIPKMDVRPYTASWHVFLEQTVRTRRFCRKRLTNAGPDNPPIRSGGTRMDIAAS
jgi:hypothetical protein